MSGVGHFVPWLLDDPSTRGQEIGQTTSGETGQDGQVSEVKLHAVKESMVPW